MTPFPETVSDPKAVSVVNNRDLKIQRRDSKENVAQKVNLRSFSLWAPIFTKLCFEFEKKPI